MIQGKGAVNALLEIYGNAIEDLKRKISEIPNDELTRIADANTSNPDCVSIQTVLSHVVYAGFGYATSIANRNGDVKSRESKLLLPDAASYCDALDSVMAFTREVFSGIHDDELETYAESDKILTGWRQRYDIEQLMEHAIVHILRHHRQIRNFLKGK